jgi:deazaflavin-dependent oxidoreductase (nitroreductase family)
MTLFELLISPRGQALDRYLVRYTGYSLINRAYARHTGIEALPALLLRSRGHKTGLWRDAVLPWFYEGSARVVVGSNGGKPEDPQWVLNLRASGEAEIFVNRGLQLVEASFAEGELYQRLWQRISTRVPGYADYQRACEGQRKIPLILLTTV